MHGCEEREGGRERVRERERERGRERERERGREGERGRDRKGGRERGREGGRGGERPTVLIMDCCCSSRCLVSSALVRLSQMRYGSSTLQLRVFNSCRQGRTGNHGNEKHQYQY